MDKAILVIDMPDSCDKCPLFCNHYSDMCVALLAIFFLSITSTLCVSYALKFLCSKDDV